MKIQPFSDQIYIKIDEVKAGILNTSSRESAVECAEVLALGQGTEGGILKVGDKIFVKAWAIDIITHGDAKYHFVNVTSGGILAKVK